MSFVIAVPEVVQAAASDLAGIRSALTAANAAAAAPTTSILAAAEDEVSAAIAALFGSHAQGYQSLSAQMATLHDEFVQLLNSGAGAYAAAEAANASPLQAVLAAVNAPPWRWPGVRCSATAATAEPLAGWARPAAMAGSWSATGAMAVRRRTPTWPAVTAVPAGCSGTAGPAVKAGPVLPVVKAALAGRCWAVVEMAGLAAPAPWRHGWDGGLHR